MVMMSIVKRSYSWNKQVIQGIDLQLDFRLQLILKNCVPRQKIFPAVILFCFLFFSSFPSKALGNVHISIELNEWFQFSMRFYKTCEIVH